ncbi:ABC transporter ATP-binding protein [Zhihengliuella halotolerans]|uniref:ABC transporter ATP-binding protein n=1 Tax=Zhihengliuella halotolerans TaxID=370736 RepID=UPI000C8037C8|nr:ATP-binding cassette domain-containing protein [Zhihengliuella halotolerans]
MSTTTAPPAAGTPAVRIRGLNKTFTSGSFVSRTRLRALRDIELEIGAGEIVALVGESGSGKSTLARCIARLEQPETGSLEVFGEDVLATQRRGASRGYRRRVQMVFQDPFGSLNPTHRVEHVLERSLRVHGKAGSNVRARLVELVESVDLDPAVLSAFPHELSGGQRQRIAIARVLAVEPEVILADEPTSMLDVSVRIGVLNLLAKLRDEHGIAILYVTHDLASARYLADRTIVMNAGSMVEGGPSMRLLDDPQHPYTRLLVGAVPDPERTEPFDPDARAELRREIADWTAAPSQRREVVDAATGHWVLTPHEHTSRQENA